MIKRFSAAIAVVAALAATSWAAAQSTRPGAPAPPARIYGQAPANLFPEIDPFARTLGPNQTSAFGADRILRFTYQQQFDCVVQPFDDRNYSGVIAARSAQQFASPECQIGAKSTIDPTGASIRKTDLLIVMVPFFETDPKQPAFTPELGKTLKKLFGFVPDAFKPQPGVHVQCPNPSDTMPGTCTMHPPTVDLGPVLTALHKVPPKTKVYVPLPNHDHLLQNSDVSTKPEWWEVETVLIMKPSVWPSADGRHGITSVTKLISAQNAGLASQAVTSNFFLFFSSMPMSPQMSGRNAM